MPYIHPDIRKELGPLGPTPKTAGELNYLITRLVNQYAEFIGPSYVTYNTIMGALTCAQMEFYRRVIVPYEEMKKDQNGDCY